MYWMGSRIPPWRKGNFVGISLLIVKHREYPTCSRYSQAYSLVGSSSAAFCYQYCGNFSTAFSALTLLVGQQEGHPAMVICLEQGADLHMARLMQLPLTISCFSKILIGFTFLVLAHPGSPRQRAVKRVCVMQQLIFFMFGCSVIETCARLFVCNLF